jgi:hypothetical protein
MEENGLSYKFSVGFENEGKESRSAVINGRAIN